LKIIKKQSDLGKPAFCHLFFKDSATFFHHTTDWLQRFGSMEILLVMCSSKRRSPIIKPRDPDRDGLMLTPLVGTALTRYTAGLTTAVLETATAGPDVFGRFTGGLGRLISCRGSEDATGGIPA
jgi:hypothetical protein